MFVGWSVSEQAEIDKAAAIIRSGGIVAFPTETFYGLAADPFNPLALQRIFELKMRPAEKAVLVLIDHIRRLDLLVTEVPSLYHSLMSRWWPGPLTLVFPCRMEVPPLLTGETGTIAVRISSNPLAQALVRAVGGPITATSANISGHEPAATVHEVIDQFGGKLDYVLDGGRTPGSGGSTIVYMKGDTLELVRPGVIPFEKLVI